MNLELANKVVLVTGSSSGLGKWISKKFLEEGAKVVITSNDKKSVEKTSEEFIKVFGEKNVFKFSGDLLNIDIIKNCISETINYYGKIDILIANIGSGKGSTEWNISEEEWEKMFEINFSGARRISNEIIPKMIANGGGTIVFISSIAGVEVIGAPIHYSAAKSALIAYSKNLSKKIAKNNIRVNTICPGNIFFEKGTWDIKLKENKEKVMKMLENNVPLNRFAVPEEISNLVVFISSEKSSFITGSCLISDGGQTVSI